MRKAANKLDLFFCQRHKLTVLGKHPGKVVHAQQVLLHGARIFRIADKISGKERLGRIDPFAVYFNLGLKLGGTMIETPAAVLIADELAAECDFFSIGTNDLTQYTHAVDRDLSIAERYYRPASHAMKKLIAMVMEAADAGQIPVTICGMAVGNPANTIQYLKLGLRSFSMSPQSLIGVKRALLEADSRD